MHSIKSHVLTLEESEGGHHELKKVSTCFNVEHQCRAVFAWQISCLHEFFRPTNIFYLLPLLWPISIESSVILHLLCFRRDFLFWTCYLTRQVKFYIALGSRVFSCLISFGIFRFIYSFDATAVSRLDTMKQCLDILHACSGRVHSYCIRSNECLLMIAATKSLDRSNNVAHQTITPGFILSNAVCQTHWTGD